MAEAAGFGFLSDVRVYEAECWWGSMLRSGAWSIIITNLPPLRVIPYIIVVTRIRASIDMTIDFDRCHDEHHE
ncbi:hypothetical protein MOX02_49210 [Methylobacterium oxalidis]|uniref:Uncharacterized protein n=1 Tax=Methylobacterium oxalidis TaxID=944322 RepID=A0A512JAB6_9HYPH|nr:hypothetical protein MOX02_49210 [Methylobacterium oxalidis]GLS65326.1 hypothetical protein GCM10007888_37080 [Methylobacterium oxalidis]